MSRTITWVLAGVLTLIFLGNGLAMLFASFAWYNAVPGVTATGPFNPHFVRDIGAIYLMCGGAVIWFLWRPVQGWPALVAAAAWLMLHVCVHIFDAACSANPVSDVIRDLPGIYLLALATAGLAYFAKPRAA
jgi:hypothetical protein